MKKLINLILSFLYWVFIKLLADDNGISIKFVRYSSLDKVDLIENYAPRNKDLMKVF